MDEPGGHVLEVSLGSKRILRGYHAAYISHDVVSGRSAARHSDKLWIVGLPE